MRYLNAILGNEKKGVFKRGEMVFTVDMTLDTVISGC